MPQRYSTPIQAFVLSDHFNRAYVMCENYTEMGISKTMDMHPRYEDDIIIVEQGQDPIVSYRARVRVDFYHQPSEMWEGAFELVQSILASDTSIADFVMKTIKEHESAVFTADMKAILDPDEQDYGDLDADDAKDYFGTYIVEINPPDEKVVEVNIKED